MPSLRITRYKFEDARRGVWGLVVGHLILGMILLMPDGTPLFSFGRGQLCLLIAMVFTIAQRHYNWLDHPVNFALIALYASFLTVEYFAFGFPDTLQPVRAYGPPSKGIMLTILLYAIPPVYVGLRVVMVAQLISVLVWGGRFRAVEGLGADASAGLEVEE